MATVIALDLFTNTKKETTGEAIEDIDIKVESTNQTKNIAGHTCKLVRFIKEKEDVIVEVWFSQDMDDLDERIYVQYFGMMGADQNLEDISGSPMEITQFEKGKKMANMVIEEMSEVNINYDMSKYKIMDMSMFGSFMQK